MNYSPARLTASLLSMVLLTCATNVYAELYKWVGPDGKITYSDVPPPKTATHVEKKNIGGSSVSTSDFPFELAEAVKNNPVTLYTGPNCIPCNDARSFLGARGIPYSEKTVESNEDIAKLRQVAGEAKLPTMVVGRNKQIGYEPDGWGSALTTANYPQASLLPKSYRNPKAEPAVPKVVAAPKPKIENTPRPSAPTPTVPDDGKPKFRF